MAKPILDSPRIVATRGKRIAAAVSEHLNVDREGKPGTCTDALDKTVDRVRGKRAAPFRGEYIAAVGILALQLAQRPQFVAADRMRGRLAVLDPAHMQRGIAAEFDLRPFQVANLDGSQPVAIGNQDQRGIAVAMAAIAAGRFHQLLDLGRGHIFPLP